MLKRISKEALLALLLGSLAVSGGRGAWVPGLRVPSNLLWPCLDVVGGLLLGVLLGVPLM